MFVNETSTGKTSVDEMSVVEMSINQMYQLLQVALVLDQNYQTRVKVSGSDQVMQSNICEQVLKTPEVTIANQYVDHCQTLSPQSNICEQPIKPPQVTVVSQEVDPYQTLLPQSNIYEISADEMSVV